MTNCMSLLCKYLSEGFFGLIRQKPSTFLMSYTEVRISALSRLLLARSDWTFHRCGIRESSLGLLEGGEPSGGCCPDVVFLARLVMKIAFKVLIVSKAPLREGGKQAVNLVSDCLKRC